MTVRFTTGDNDIECVNKDLRYCLAPADRARSLPPLCYASESAARLETARILRRGWIGLGRADRVAEPGDSITLDIAGAPIAMLRDKANVLRVFANTCRHRGARPMNGEGRCPAIRCPFHSWSYGLDGRLVAAPDMEDAKEFDKADYGLIEFAVEERAGFAFAGLSGDAPDLDAWLGDRPDRRIPLYASPAFRPSASTKRSASRLRRRHDPTAAGPALRNRQ